MHRRISMQYDVYITDYNYELMQLSLIDELTKAQYCIEPYGHKCEEFGSQDVRRYVATSAAQT